MPSNMFDSIGKFMKFSNRLLMNRGIKKNKVIPKIKENTIVITRDKLVFDPLGASVSCDAISAEYESDFVPINNISMRIRIPRSIGIFLAGPFKKLLRVKDFVIIDPVGFLTAIE